MKQKLKKQMILLPPAEPSPTIGQKIISSPAWKKWSKAVREVFPFYLALHVGLLVIDCFASILEHGNTAWQQYPISTLWTAWVRWDVYHYLYITTYGYPAKPETAFFPLYPFLTGFLLQLHICSDPIAAQFIVSNLAWLILMTVLYQLVKEDLSKVIAQRAIIYHSIFPTAFFLAAGYNESLLLCLVLLSFYQMRHGRWWLAGIFGFFACLTRVTGILLVVPFAYEYLYQNGFNIKQIMRPSIASILLIPAGIGAFMVYTQLLFNDWLSFLHVEMLWDHHFEMPWVGIFIAIQLICQAPFLSFQSLRNLTDLLPDLFVLAALIAGWIGPWKLPRRDWSYLLFGSVFWLLLQCTPILVGYPLASVGRYMLEVFPAFIVAARIGTHKGFHFNYMCISLAMYAYLIIAYLAGYWVL